MLATPIGMVGQEEPSDLDVERISVNWLISELDRHQRRPPWYDDVDPPDSFGPVDSTFQKEGKVVWLAYQSAKKRASGPTRFDGQAALRRKVQELDRAASYHIDAVAKKLRDTISPELRERVAGWAGHRRKRRRTDIEWMLSPTPPPPASPNTAGENRPTISSLCTQQPSNTYNTLPNVRGIITESSFPVLSRPFTALGSQHSFSTTSPSKAKAILPDDLFHALNKSYSSENKLVACIGMSYSKEREYCQIALDIHPSKVQRFAQELFGVNLETNAGLRYLAMGYIKVLPSPKTTIQGCRLDVMESFFGRMLYSAIQASGFYKRDIQELSDHTRAVSMEVSRNAEDVAVLTLRTDCLRFADVWAELYDYEQCDL
ncbi:hypothetical protein F5Y10DRAFT_238505 [Nemania abortiva]|nr:hypothetical protein F5Y10DRAFT_238505 [Nemania abortiva]